MKKTLVQFAFFCLQNDSKGLALSKGRRLTFISAAVDKDHTQHNYRSSQAEDGRLTGFQTTAAKYSLAC